MAPQSQILLFASTSPVGSPEKLTAESCAIQPYLIYLECTPLGLLNVQEEGGCLVLRRMFS